MFDGLNQAIDNLNKNLCNDHCDYVEPKKISCLKEYNQNLIMLQCNTRGLYSSKYELSQLLSNLKRQKTEIVIVILSETLLTEIKRECLVIKGYNMVSKERQIKGDGVAILIGNKLRYKIREDLSTFYEAVFENIIIEVEHSKKLTIVCSPYRAPNSSEAEFNHYYKQLLGKLILERNKTFLIGMDQNLDLLKSHIHLQTETFLENTLNANLIPTITIPTRITKSSATLIDNVYISNQLHYRFDSCILFSDILDHMPSLTIVLQNKCKKIGPVKFKTCNVNENRTKQLVAKL